ncbi:MAG: DUF1772 domain-containing protein [Chryseolinea sp.]
MGTLILRFANLILSGILAGALFAIMMAFNSKSISFPSYLVQQQNVIKAFNELMPLIGFAAIILTLVTAFKERGNKTIVVSLIAAAVLLILSGLITKFGNQPINTIVMTWNDSVVPKDWTALRDKWLTLHTVRTILSFLAFCIIGWSNIRR